MTKQQACELLHISESTLQRRLRAKKYTCTRTGEGQYAPITFTFADLGLTEPTPEPTADLASAEPTAAPVVVPAVKPDTRTWEQRHRDGDAPDSCGNFLDGHNDQFPSNGASLVGPCYPREPIPPNRDTASHMDQALVGHIGPSANDGYLDSLERHRDVGNISQATYDSLAVTASKARRLSKQQEKQCVDIAVIREAFRFGFSR